MRLRGPIGYGRSFHNPRVNWMYQTEPEAGLAGRSGYWPRSRVLGRSSTINAMVYMRGLPRDFDDWRDAGNPGWGWDDVLPHVRRLESYAGAGSEDGRRAAPTARCVLPTVATVVALREVVAVRSGQGAASPSTARQP